MNTEPQCPPNGSNLYDVVRSGTSLMHGRQLFRLCIFVTTVWAVLQLQDVPQPTPILMTLVFMFLVMVGLEVFSEFKRPLQAPIMSEQPSKEPLRSSDKTETPTEAPADCRQEPKAAPISPPCTVSSLPEAPASPPTNKRTKIRSTGSPREAARRKHTPRETSSSVPACIPA